MVDRPDFNLHPVAALIPGAGQEVGCGDDKETSYYYVAKNNHKSCNEKLNFAFKVKTT